MEAKWIELNVEVKLRNAEDARAVLVGLVRPLVEEFKRLVPGERSWHYLWEDRPWPHTLRLRFYGDERQVEGFRTLLEERLRDFRSEHPDLVGDYCYGRHGECGLVYAGEVEDYGEGGWRLIMRMLELGAETALELITNPDPERYRVREEARQLLCPKEEPQHCVAWYYAERYTHLFLNQVAFFVDELMFYLKQLELKYGIVIRFKEPEPAEQVKEGSSLSRSIEQLK